jgi:hypothetical protein
MKRLAAVSLIVLLGSGFLTAIRLVHLGPFKVRRGDNVVLARLSTTNGGEFIVIAHRTQSVTEPYEVTLYRVEPDRRTFSYYLSFEDSYWWSCSLASNTTSGDIEIRANSRLAARYLPVKDVVISDAYRVAIPPRPQDYAVLQQLVATSMH